MQIVKRISFSFRSCEVDGISVKLSSGTAAGASTLFRVVCSGPRVYWKRKFLASLFFWFFTEVAFLKNPARRGDSSE